MTEKQETEVQMIGKRITRKWLFLFKYSGSWLRCEILLTYKYISSNVLAILTKCVLFSNISQAFSLVFQHATQ